MVFACAKVSATDLNDGEVYFYFSKQSELIIFTWGEAIDLQYIKAAPCDMRLKYYASIQL